MTQQCASEKYQVRKLTWEEVETIYRTHMQKDFPRGEIERIDQAQNAEELQTRTRRKQFYLKNGFCETGIFTKADGGIDYEIICFSIRKELRDEEAACAMRNIYETFFAEGEYAVYEN